MDTMIVGIIIIAALVFSIRGFIKICKGEGNCSCKGGCACSSKEFCNAVFPVLKNK